MTKSSSTQQATEYDQSDQIQKLRQLVTNDATGQSWDLAWKNNIIPWDKGQIQAPLKELIESNKVHFPTSGRALVPGCGRGYDAVYIASRLGLETVGMDISATAIEAAVLNLKNTAIPEGIKIIFETKNFFEYHIANEYDKFDLCYDYTFFVALPPFLRTPWGSQMRELVKKGGYLVTLIFPVDGARLGGPPYSVDTELYAKALQGEAGEEAWIKVLEEDTNRPERRGREKIAVWKRQ